MRGSLVLVLSLLAGTAQAQDLGAAAAKERARREAQKDKSGKVITNDDLGTAKGNVVVGGGVTVASPAPPATSDPAGRPSEVSWRTRARASRAELAQAEQAVKTLEDQVKALGSRMLLSTDTNEILRLRTQRQQAEQALAGARTKLAEAKQRSDDLAEQARRAGVPPGWLREP